MKLIVFFSILLIPFFARGQQPQPPESEERLAVNKYDDRGKKHGMWLTSTPPRMGEEGISEFGNYLHGKKTGNWYRVDENGDLVSIENFRNDLLDGEVKYYDKGRLYCTGNYRALKASNPFDTIVVVDPISYEERYKVISTQIGSIRHGTWKYYHPPTGQVIREEEYQGDELVLKKDYEVSASLDSINQQIHQMRLPHNKKQRYSHPKAKRSSFRN